METEETQTAVNFIFGAVSPLINMAIISELLSYVRNWKEVKIISDRSKTTSNNVIVNMYCKTSPVRIEITLKVVTYSTFIVRTGIIETLKGFVKLYSGNLQSLESFGTYDLVKTGCKPRGNKIPMPNSRN